MATRFPEPAVQKSLAGDLTLLDADDRWLTDLALALVRTAKAHAAQPCSRLPSSPGIGTILALGRLYDIHDIRRVPRGQAFVSSCRLVKGARASAGTRDGPSGQTIGQASLTWAFSEAAVLLLRRTPAQTTAAHLCSRESCAS